MALLINEACSSVRTADKIKGMARKPCLFNFLPHWFQPFSNPFSREFKIIRVHSRSFAAKLLFLICVFLRKSAAKFVQSSAAQITNLS